MKFILSIKSKDLIAGDSQLFNNQGEINCAGNVSFFIKYHDSFAWPNIFVGHLFHRNQIKVMIGNIDVPADTFQNSFFLSWQINIFDRIICADFYLLYDLTPAINF